MSAKEIADMIPYDIDPSLHDRAPQAQTLDDGFAPPRADEHEVAAEESLEEALATKSQF